jgi:beta-lactamase class A
MGAPAELPRDTAPTRASRRGGRRLAPRPVTTRTFASSLRALEALAGAGAQVSLRVDDLDRRTSVLAGDDHLVLPVAGLGVVPLLIEVAARFEDGSLDPLELVDRQAVAPAGAAGTWQHLATSSLPLADLAVLAASTGDTLAANALLGRVGLDGVRARIEGLGLTRTAIMDHFRDSRGPDDAPHPALGSAREYAALFSVLVGAQAVSVRVSERIAGWLSLNQDLGLVGAATGLDPFAHTEDPSGLVLVNKTGREPGVRAEAGVIAGPRAGLSYALIVRFDERAITHGVRIDECFRALGVDLMEYVY